MYKALRWTQRERNTKLNHRKMPRLECELKHELTYLYVTNFTKTNIKYQVDSCPRGDASVAVKPNNLILW